MSCRTLVGFHFWRKFEQRYVLNDTRQVNCRFHAGVTAADNRYAFAFKQRAVAVRAVGHAFGAILIFARERSCCAIFAPVATIMLRAFSTAPEAVSI